MSEILGLEGKLYRNTGSYASPTWDLVECVENVNLNLDKSTADVSTRGGGGWKQERTTLKQASLDMSLLYDPADTDFQALLDAWTGDEKVEFAVMDGPIATVGSQGLRATMQGKGFPIDQSLEDAFKVASTWIVTRGTTPEWYEISV